MIGVHNLYISSSLQGSVENSLFLRSSSLYNKFVQCYCKPNNLRNCHESLFHYLFSVPGKELFESSENQIHIPTSLEVNITHLSFINECVLTDVLPAIADSDAKQSIFSIHLHSDTHLHSLSENTYPLHEGKKKKNSISYR